MKKIFKLLTCVFMVIAMIAFSGQFIFAETHTSYMSAHPATDPGAGAKGVFFQSGVIDCNDTRYFASGVTNGDVIQIVRLPINTIVQAIFLRTTRGTIQTDQANSCTAGTSGIMGDGNNTRGFINNAYTNTMNVPWIDLGKTFSGVSVWRAGHHSSQVISGVSNTGTSGSLAGVSNYGAYLSGGVSVYKSRDTIDMTVYVDRAASSGVTPKFEYMIECIKLPTN